MEVLVTGAAGSIGQPLCAGLARLGHRVRGLDLVPEPTATAGAVTRWLVGDCLDPAAVDAAVAGTDAVVHLASNPLEAALPDCLESHVHTTGRLLDAMVRHEVPRLVYASSNHAVGLTRRSALPPRQHEDSRGLLGTDVPPRPDTFYGVAKVAAEALLQRYADRSGIVTFALRIGSFGERPQTRRQLSTWLSPADMIRLVHACLTAPVDDTGPTGRHTVVHGISANTRAWWDLAPGRAIGYAPVDDAEEWAADLPRRVEDRAEADLVGGPLAGAGYDRPAFEDGA